MMNTGNKKCRWVCLVVFLITSTGIIWFYKTDPAVLHRLIPAPRPVTVQHVCPSRPSTQTITPLNNTKHLLISAYMDRRVGGWDVRIIGIFRINSIVPLHCVFCCGGHVVYGTQANIAPHPEHFGFPFVTTDVMCRIPAGCNATHVTLSIHQRSAEAHQHTLLPICNLESSGTEERKPQFNFTVCISNLFGDYNNVLQFAQALEMYRFFDSWWMEMKLHPCGRIPRVGQILGGWGSENRDPQPAIRLLGVDRVVVYNTSCGPDLNLLLHSYRQEGFVEMVPWPIDKHLQPSHGWLQSRDGGELHYFGQMTTLNECIYRYMDRSRYVLLNDIDEIIMPYRHNSLVSLMDELQQQQPKAGVFLIENHIFPKHHFEPSAKFHLPQWEGVPGINILEHIYREEPDRSHYHPHKLIVQPRMVEQTSIHEVLKNFGNTFKVPPDVCRLIHVRVALRGSLTLEQLHVDTRLWDFHEQLIPRVDEALRRIGMLRTKE